VFESVLVANRGEIARRIIRTTQRMGLRAVAVYSEADADLPFVHEADEAILLGPAAPAQSYRNPAAVLEAARQGDAQAIHPGYGFLSEDPTFAAAVGAAGLVWVGPSAEAIEQMEHAHGLGLEVLVTGGGGAVEGLAATLIRAMNGKHESKQPRPPRRRDASSAKSRESSAAKL